MNHLPDINVWLALTFSGHPHHSAALTWFDGVASNSCAFCRMTQQGFLRWLSNPEVFLSDALSLPAAWQAFDALMDDDRTYFSNELSGIDAEWRNLTNDSAFSAKFWNDAFLVAFAKVSRLQMVTLDRGFKRYPGLNVRWIEG